MKDLFMCLLLNMQKHGNLTSALLKDETYATVSLESNGAQYLVTVIKKEVEEEKNV